MKVKLGEGPGDVVRFKHPYGSVVRLPDEDDADAGGIVALGDVVDVYCVDGTRHRGRIAGLGDVIPTNRGGGASRFDLLHYAPGGRCLPSSAVVGRQLEVNIPRSAVRGAAVESAGDSRDWTWTVGRAVSLRTRGGDGEKTEVARAGVIKSISSDRTMCKVAFGGSGAGRSVACFPDALAGLLEAARATLERGGRLYVQAEVANGTANGEPPGNGEGKLPDGGSVRGAVDISAGVVADGKSRGEVEITASVEVAETSVERPSRAEEPWRPSSRSPPPESTSDGRHETASCLRERLRQMTDERDEVMSRLVRAEADRDDFGSRLEAESAGRARDRTERDGAEAETARVHRRLLERVRSDLEASARRDGGEDGARPEADALRAELNRSILDGYVLQNEMAMLRHEHGLEVARLRCELDGLRGKTS